MRLGSVLGLFLGLLWAGLGLILLGVVLPRAIWLILVLLCFVLTFVAFLIGGVWIIAKLVGIAKILDDTAGEAGKILLACEAF